MCSRGSRGYPNSRSTGHRRPNQSDQWSTEEKGQSQRVTGGPRRTLVEGLYDEHELRNRVPEEESLEIQPYTGLGTRGIDLSEWTQFTEFVLGGLSVSYLVFWVYLSVHRNLFSHESGHRRRTGSTRVDQRESEVDRMQDTRRVTWCKRIQWVSIKDIGWNTSFLE